MLSSYRRIPLFIVSIIANIVVSSFVLLGLLTTSPLRADEPKPMIAAGHSFFCVADGIRGNGILCSEQGRDLGIVKVPAIIRSVESLSAGAWHACAVFRPKQKSQALCWGDSRFQSNELPPSIADEEPREIKSVMFTNCVLFASKSSTRIGCSGMPSDQFSTPPKDILNPGRLTAVDQHYCVVAKNSQDRTIEMVHCWGKTLNGQWPLVDLGLKNGDTASCLRDPNKPDGLPICRAEVMAHSPNERAAFTVKKGSVTCELAPSGDNQLSCKGSSMQAVTLESPGLGVGGSLIEACAIKQAGGIKCLNYETGLTREMATPGMFWRFQLNLKEARDIIAFCQILSSYTYSFDKALLRSLQERFSTATNEQLKLAVEALAPYFGSFSYHGVLKERMSETKDSMLEFLKKSPPSEGNLSADDKGFIASMLAIVIQTTKPVLLRTSDSPDVESQVKIAEEMVSLLGQSVANQQSMNVSELARLKEFLLSISVNGYVGNRVPSMMLMAERL